MLVVNFYRRTKRRFLDQMTHFQLSVQSIVVVIAFLFFNIVIWAKVPKFFVTELGCYIAPYILNSIAPYMGSHSFFIALFRYICINHPNRLSNLNISPEVRWKWNSVPYFPYVCTIIFQTEIWTHHCNCRATFPVGCVDYYPSKKPGYNFFSRTTLTVSTIHKYIIVYFLFWNDKDTFDIFRDDSIVIAITFWQWFVEFIFNLLGIELILGLRLKVDSFLSLFNI